MAQLRQRIAGVLAAAGGTYPDADADTLAAAVLAVVQPEMAELAETDGVVRALRRQRDTAEAALARVRGIHRPVDGRTGWDGAGNYGDIEPACSACGSDEDANRYPCPTIRALDPPPST